MLKNRVEPKILLPTDVAFVNFNEKEESTCIESITLMRLSYFKTYVLVPLLSILTIFFLPLKMYWNNETYAKMLFYTVIDIT